MALRYRAFIFDDDETIRDLLVDLCEEAGWEAHGYESPAASPMCVGGTVRWDNREDCVDLVIADVRMPDVNGVDFMWSAQLAGHAIDYAAMISGFWTASMEEQVRAMGVQVFRKPFSVTEMIAWLESSRAAGKPQP